MEKIRYGRDGEPISPDDAVKVRADVFPGSAHLHVERGGIVCGMVSLTWTGTPDALHIVGAAVANFITELDKATAAANEAVMAHREEAAGASIVEKLSKLS